LELLDDLSELEFPDYLFRRIRPSGHSMTRYRDYARGLQKRFTRASSSQLLCDRIHLIVTYTRTSPSLPVSAAA